MNIVFMGTPAFAVPILKAVHKYYGVNLVVTQPDKQVGRKRTIVYSPVKEFALEHNIKVYQPKRIKDDYDTVLNAKPDLIITAAYGQIIPEILLNTPKYGAINVHGSLLPLLRGGAPIQRAIERLYSTTGITIMYMVKKMDAGDIIAQRSIPILSTDTSEVLFEKLSYVGRDLLLETIPKIVDGEIKATQQEEQLATYAYNIKREEEHLDLSLTKEQIDAKMRAFTPTPLVYVLVNQNPMKIHRLKYLEDTLTHEVENGTIVEINKDEIVVKVENGYIALLEVQLPGKKPQNVGDFMNGKGRSLLEVGTILK
ncbi:MAG: methionyl-tRNA formyltransferase [Candidatus Izemoplasmataceae bacterium]